MSRPYRLVSLLVAVMVLLSTVALPIAAQEQADPPLTEQSTYEAFSGIVDEYNTEQATFYSAGYYDFVGVGVLKHFLAGERVNVHVTDEDTGEVETFSFLVTDELFVGHVRPSERADATARVEVNRATVEDIMLAEDPLLRLRWHVLEGNVKIRGARGSHADQVRWTLMKASTNVVRPYVRMYQILDRVYGERFTYELWKREGV